MICVVNWQKGIWEHHQEARKEMLGQGPETRVKEHFQVKENCLESGKIKKELLDTKNHIVI